MALRSRSGGVREVGGQGADSSENRQRQGVREGSKEGKRDGVR